MFSKIYDLATFLFIIVIGYAMGQTLHKELGFTVKNRKSRRVKPDMITYLDFANDITLWGRDGIPVRSPDSQSREPGFKSHCGEVWSHHVATVRSAV